MKLYLPGEISELEQLNAGECIIFNSDRVVRAGLVVQAGDGDKSVLDFDYQDDKHGSRFQIYNGAHFQNESIIAISKARIVPIIATGAMMMGLHSNGASGRALYLTAGGPVVYAGYQRSPYKINLADGSIYKGDLGYQLHTTRWRIEFEDGAGDFQTLREFEA